MFDQLELGRLWGKLLLKLHCLLYVIAWLFHVLPVLYNCVLDKIQAIRRVSADNGSDGLLVVDDSYAFNSLIDNLSVAPHNIQYLLPTIAIIVINTDRYAAALFVDKDVSYSNEGTTQGIPQLRMSFMLWKSFLIIQKITQFNN